MHEGTETSTLKAALHIADAYYSKGAGVVWSPPQPPVVVRAAPPATPVTPIRAATRRHGPASIRSALARRAHQPVDGLWQVSGNRARTLVVAAAVLLLGGLLDGRRHPLRHIRKGSDAQV